MEPRVQYAPTADGGSVAYSVIGEGPVLVYAQPYSHQLLDWQEPDMAAYYGALAEGHTLVRYDMRPLALSQCEDFELSFDTLLADLDAVVERTGADSFDLMAVSGLGLLGIDYAANHPERVKHLVVWGTPRIGSEFQKGTRLQSIQAVAHIDPEIATEIQARFIFGDRETLTPERLRHANEVFKLQDILNYIDVLTRHDPGPSLELLRVPTLVLHPRGRGYITSGMSRELAAAIQGAEFMQVESDYYPYQAADIPGLVALLDDFLSNGSSPNRGSTRSGESSVHTILFTDLEEHTAIMSRLGDDRGRDVLREHERLTREALRAHGGSEVKSMGDGFMASFGSAQRAIECARAIQQAFGDAVLGEQLKVRIGINAGEPVAEDDDLFGASVITAARIAAQANGGQVLVANVVRELVAGKGFLFHDTGEHVLKGFEEPARLWELRLG